MIIYTLQIKSAPPYIFSDQAEGLLRQIFLGWNMNVVTLRSTTDLDDILSNRFIVNTGHIAFLVGIFPLSNFECLKNIYKGMLVYRDLVH